MAISLLPSVVLIIAERWGQVKGRRRRQVWRRALNSASEGVKVSFGLCANRGISAHGRPILLNESLG